MAGDSIVSAPRVSLTLRGAQQSAGVTEHKVLIVGEVGGYGTYTAGTLYENAPVDDATIDALVGNRSQVGRMLKNFRKINKTTRVDFIGLSQPD